MKERLQLAYINAYAGKAVNDVTAILTLSQIIDANRDLINDGFVYEKQTGEKSYQISSIKINESEIGEIVAIPNNGSVTLNVTINENFGGTKKYYGIVNGKYYEIKLINSKIELENEAKTLQEINSEGEQNTPTLGAKIDNEAGDTANVNVSVNTTQNQITLTDNGAGSGRIKITYGENVTRFVRINIPTITLTYNSNGGSGTMNSQQGSNLIVAENGFTAPSGKRFVSWNTSYDGTGTTYVVGAQINSNTTLYAIWEDITYVITYNKNDGSETTRTQNKIGNNSVTLDIPEGFARTGYEIAKWNTQADGLGTDYAVGSTYSTNSNLNLYAVWQEEQVQSYSVKLVGPVSWDENVLSAMNNNKLRIYCIVDGVEHQLSIGDSFLVEEGKDVRIQGNFYDSAYDWRTEIILDIYVGELEYTGNAWGPNYCGLASTNSKIGEGPECIDYVDISNLDRNAYITLELQIIE